MTAKCKKKTLTILNIKSIMTRDLFTSVGWVNNNCLILTIDNYVVSSGLKSFLSCLRVYIDNDPVVMLITREKTLGLKSRSFFLLDLDAS
jgi:hypothetical protein